MNPKTLILKDIIGIDTAVSTDDGEKVFQAIDLLLKLDTIVELDFSGITIMTTAFLNAAIGQLYSTYIGDQLNKNLILKNVTPENKGRLLQVVERAKEYFSNKKKFENTVSEIIYGN
jgi:hypothetical protein